MADYRFEPGSFRDRSSRVFYGDDGAVLRVLNQSALRDWQLLSSSKFFHTFMADGKVVSTEQTDIRELGDINLPGDWVAVLRHQAIPFISYSYEWSFGMLKDCALLHLDLLLAALEEGMILKDSSAFNCQWLGANPMFIDIPSFEKHSTGEPWVGYRQFCQMFLYPLFLQAYKQLPFQSLLRGNIDGVDAEFCSRIMSPFDLLRSGVLVHLYFQAKMQARYGSTPRDVKKTLHTAGFNRNMIRANVARLRKITGGLSWKARKSEWSEYDGCTSYSEADQNSKATFVREAVRTRTWNLAWDLGCNNGTFARIAAENARYVVATDADHLVIERLYQELKQEGNGSILPLVSSLTDPSPNLGWRGLERRALVERGKPDLVLCLALIHHVVISANIPLPDFVHWLASLGASLIIEFVTKSDPMVKKLLLNKEDIYSDYEVDRFEQCLSESFEVVRREPLATNTRILYFARPGKPAGTATRSNTHSNPGGI